MPDAIIRDSPLREATMVCPQDTTPDLAFDLVFHGQRDYVYRLAVALLAHTQDAEDVTQEVFLRVYRALPSYDARRGSLRSWLTRITVNACNSHRRRNFWRRLAAPAPVPAGSPALDVIDPSRWGTPEDQVLLGELREALRIELARLRPVHRTVLILHYYLDYSCAEIAQITHCSEGTVCSRLYYARRRLQAQLEKHSPPTARKEWL